MSAFRIFSRFFDLIDVDKPALTLPKFLFWNPTTQKVTGRTISWNDLTDKPNLSSGQSVDLTPINNSLATKAPLISPDLIGTPTVPTAALGANTTQIANMAAVKAAVDSLIANAPGALDTLNEIAQELSNSESAVSQLITAISVETTNRQSADNTLSTSLISKVDVGDTRLSDSRNPTAHKISHSVGGSDAIIPFDIGAAPLNSPGLTGIPTAPTATFGTNTTQIATMAAVQAAISALVNGAPTALDTLNELATLLQSDTDALNVLITTVQGKADRTLSNLTDTTVARSNLGLGNSATKDIGNGIGNVAAGTHNHAGEDITSGTISVSRIGNGIKDNTTFLRGDGNFAVPPVNTGPKGDTGAQGIQGVKGDTGPQGTAGINGTNGSGGGVLVNIVSSLPIASSNTRNNFYALNTTGAEDSLYFGLQRSTSGTYALRNLFTGAYLTGYKPPVGTLVNTSQSISSGLVLSLPFNESTGTVINDRTSTPDNGTLASSTNMWAADDMYDTSINFTSYNASVPHVSKINVETFTVAFAFKTFQTGGYATNQIYTTMFGKESSAKYPFAAFFGYPNVGQVEFSLYSGASGANPAADASANSYNNGTWHKCIMTRVQGGAIRVFIDGILRASATDFYAAGATLNTSPIIFGSEYNNTNRFPGQIAYFHMWNRVLTGAPASVGSAATGEILDLFNDEFAMYRSSSAPYKPVAGSSINTTLSISNGLALSLPFNEGSSTSVADKSSSPINGVLSSSSLWGVDSTYTNTLSFGSGNLSVAHGTKINLETYTISCAFKTTQTTLGCLFNKLANPIFPMSAYINDYVANHIEAEMSNGSTNPYADSGININDGLWHKLVITRQQGSFIKIYIDGIYRGSSNDPYAAGVTLNTAALVIGQLNTGSYPFNGQIAYFNIWNRVLTGVPTNIGDTATGEIASITSDEFSIYRN